MRTRKEIFRFAGVWACVAVLAAACGSSPAQNGSVAAWVPRKISPLDQQVELSIHKGMQSLLACQKPDGTWSSAAMKSYPGAMESLVLLAAASAGEDLRQPKLKASLDYVLSLSPMTVTARSLRAMLYAQLPVEQYGLRLTADIDWLQQQQETNGGWGLGPGHPLMTNYPDWVDSTNSLWAVLALGAGGQSGVGMSTAVLEKARAFWISSQNTDGGWGYQPPGEPRVRGESYGSTTAAGTAALLTITNLLMNAETASGSTSGGNTASQNAIARGVKWLTDHYSTRANPNWQWGPTDECLNYYLFCVQSAVDAGGMRRLASRPWHADVAGALLSQQSPQGTWRQPNAGNEKEDPYSTALGVLCLAQAGSGLGLSKLGDDAVPRNNDAANMVRMLGAAVGRTVSYQTLTGNEPDAIFEQAPLLYLSVPAAGLSKPVAERIAGYVRGGGVALLAAPEGKAPQIAATLQALVPQWTATPLAAGHPIFSNYYKFSAEGLMGLGDATQTRVFLVPPSFADVWSGKRIPNCPARQFLANLLMYATDFSLPAQSRIVSPARRKAPLQNIPVARLQHRANWNVYPRALERLGESLAAAIDRGVSESAADPGSPIAPAIPLLWLTGAADPPQLTTAEIGNLKTFIANGGTLFIDAGGGAKFQKSAVELAAALFPKAKLHPLPKTHTLLTGLFAEGIGANITAVRYTRSAQATSALPELLGLEFDGRLAVIISPYAVTATMDGHVPFGCKGYEPDDARRIAANIVLYAASRR